MDSMEIDNTIPAPGSAGIVSGVSTGSGQFDKTANGAVYIPPGVSGPNRPANGGVDLAKPIMYDGFISHHHEKQTDPETRLPLLHNHGGQNSQRSAIEDSSGSEDELMEGEMSWTTPLASPKLLPTGLCYDVRMRYHCELDPPKQRLDFHPEDPRRIYHIYRELCQAGLYKDPQFNVPIVEKPLQRIQARNATPSEICLVHTPAHYNFVESTAGMKSLHRSISRTLTSI